MRRELVVAAHGKQYAIVADDEGLIGRKIAGGKPYEAELLEHIYEQGYKGIAFDVGASIGNHTLWLARMCELEVWAFEADPDTRWELEQNLNLNGYKTRGAARGTVHVRAGGLSDRRCTADVAPKGRLSIRDDDDGSVQLNPMDEFNFSGVSVIKIDVEDMEPEVIRGGRELLEEQRPDVYAEARDETAHALLAQELEPLGYRMTRRFNSRSVATPVEKWVPRYKPHAR